MSYTASQIRENILNDPGYWVEEINGQLYDAIVRFMEDNNMTRSDLAKHLNLSKGRISQILNDGEINFSLEKIVSLLLKVDRYPIIRFEKKSKAPVMVNYDILSKYTAERKLSCFQEVNDGPIINPT